MSGLSSDRDRAIVECNPDALVVIDRQGTITDVNAASVQLFGRSRDEVVGHGFELLLAEGSERLHLDAFATLELDPGQRRLGHELELFAQRGDGESFPVEVTYGALAGTEEILASFRDVSHRHRAEAGLRSALSLLSATLESTADGILVVSSNGSIAGSNSRFAEMWGIPPELVESQDDERLMAYVLNQLLDPEGFLAKVRDLYDHPEAESDDVLEFRDGRVFERYSRPQMVGSESVGRVWSFRDVTPRVLAQREAEQARAEALGAARAKADFLATMSHEIRTPMNGVIGLTTLLLGTELNGLQRQYANGLRGAGEALLSIIDDILDYSKLEAGKVGLEHVPLSPHDLVDEVGLLLADGARRKGVSFSTECAPGVPELVLGDPGRLRQVLINLAGNAVKFTPSGTVVLSVADVGGASEDGEISLCFEIRDTGIGIEPAALPLLFQPFAQADASTTRRFGGTGLGLAISSSLVEAMGGKLTVQSDPGVGSTFGFTLSCAVTASSGVRAQRPDESLSARSARGSAARLTEETDRGLVLVAEDNPVNQMVAVGMLEQLGYRAQVVPDGAAALAALENGSFDLVLMDCHMPEVDGFEATRRLREREGDDLRTPVVAMTAGVLDDDRERCRQAGMDDFVAKPIDVEQLGRALDRWIHGQQDHPPVAGPAAPEQGPLLDQDRLQTLRTIGPPGGWGVLPGVVRLFLAQVPAQKSEISAAAGAGDDQRLVHVVHALKGAAGNIGATRLMSSCLAVEEESRQAGAMPEPDVLTRLTDDIEATCHALQELLGTVD